MSLHLVYKQNLKYLLYEIIRGNRKCCYAKELVFASLAFQLANFQTLLFR
jgi:hypothetical protein